MTQIVIKQFSGKFVVQKCAYHKVTTLYAGILPEPAERCAKEEIANLNRLGLRCKVLNKVSFINL